MTTYRIYTQKVDVKTIKNSKPFYVWRGTEEEKKEEVAQIVKECIDSQNYQRILVVEYADSRELKGNDIFNWHMPEDALSQRLAEVEKIKAREAELKAQIKELEAELKKLQAMH